MFNNSKITAQEYSLYLGCKVLIYNGNIGKLTSVDLLNKILQISFGDSVHVEFYFDEVKLILRKFPSNMHYNPNDFKHYLKAGYDIKILPSGSFVYEDELKKDYEKENIIH